MRNNQNLIWIDLEMTGLVPEHDKILEIATVVTDKDLNILAEGPVFSIYQDFETLAAMDEWNTNQHTRSGLLERVRQSQTSAKDAEHQTLKFLGDYLDPGRSPMCGNSICQDRRFLYHYMPKLERFFHYRHIDVSTIKELTARWKPEARLRFNKKSAHLALADVHASILELKHYRTHFFKE